MLSLADKGLVFCLELVPFISLLSNIVTTVKPCCLRDVGNLSESDKERLLLM